MLELNGYHGAVDQGGTSRLIHVLLGGQNHILEGRLVAIAPDVELAVGWSFVIASKICRVRVDPEGALHVPRSRAELAVYVVFWWWSAGEVLRVHVCAAIDDEDCELGW